MMVAATSIKTRARIASRDVETEDIAIEAVRRSGISDLQVDVANDAVLRKACPLRSLGRL